jgi:hypothetical protein
MERREMSLSKEGLNFGISETDLDTAIQELLSPAGVCGSDLLNLDELFKGSESVSQEALNELLQSHGLVPNKSAHTFFPSAPVAGSALTSVEESAEMTKKRKPPQSLEGDKEQAKSVRTQRGPYNKSGYYKKNYPEFTQYYGTVFGVETLVYAQFAQHLICRHPVPPITLPKINSGCKAVPAYLEECTLCCPFPNHGRSHVAVAK